MDIVESLQYKIFISSDPKEDLENDVKNAIESLRESGEQGWLIRALVLLCSLQNETEDSIKSEIKNYYATKKNSFNILALIEASRACCIIDDTEEALAYLAEVEDILDFKPELIGVNAKFTDNGIEHTRLVCAVRSDYTTSVPSSGIERVPLRSDNGESHEIVYTNEEDTKKCTSLLSDFEYLCLLLRAAIEMAKENVANTNEIVLSYIHRITETEDFDRIHWSIQEQALYFRTLLEADTIQEIERGTLQLAKISEFLPTAKSLGNYIPCVEPITWKEIDSCCAQRMVAVSDFSNALPYFKKLGKSLQTAECLSCIGNPKEALEVLDQALEENPSDEIKGQISMLKGDIGLNPQFWEDAWKLGSITNAKLRLYNYAIAHGGSDVPAEQHLKDILKVHPTDTQALIMLGKVCISQQNWHDAVGYLRKAVAETDDDYNTWQLLASALVHDGEPKLALHALKQAIRVNRNEEVDAGTWSNYVALSSQVNDWDDVILGFSRLLESDIDKSAPFITKLMGCYLNLVTNFLSTPYAGVAIQNQFMKLVNEFRNIVEADDPMIARLTGKALIWAGSKDEGTTLLYKALEKVIESSDDSDEKSKMRVQLYLHDLTEAVGSDPDWQTRLQAIKERI